jgi:hypothetical protein
VHDIKVEDRDLVIATHGRAFYVMDDISPLRQWGTATSDAELTVFKPQDALRGLDRTLRIDYQLKQTADKITVEVLDAQNRVIRTFNGTRADSEKKPEPPTIEDIFNPKDPKPSTLAGIQRLEWDIRYDRATDFPGLIMWDATTRGPVAPPGAYQVRVTADGHTGTQSFAVKREPHLLADVTDADLQREFQLALQIRDTTAKANQAVLLVRGIRPQIQDRAGKLDSKTGPTAKALEALEKTLTAVETEVYQVKNQSFEDPLNFPIMLNNKIASLQGIVESADAPPTDQTYEMFKLLSGRLDEQMNKLDTAVQKDLPQVNQLLQRQKLTPIKPVPLKPEDPKAKPKSDR